MFEILNVCGSAFSGGIPSKLAYIVNTLIKIIQIVVPVLLIIWGMLDLGKAVMAQKEDEIKKGQQTFIKRIIAAIIVFFVIVIVRLVVGLVADDTTIVGCLDEIFTCNSASC